MRRTSSGRTSAQHRSILLAVAVSLALGVSGRAAEDYSADQAEMILLVLKQIPTGNIQPEGYRAILRPIMAGKGLTKNLADRIDADVAFKGSGPFVKALLLEFNGANQAVAASAIAQPAKADAATRTAEAAPAAAVPARGGGVDSTETKTSSDNPGTQPAANPKSTTPPATAAAPSMWQILMWSGAKLQNPYSIVDGKLKPGNTQTDGFIDLQLIHRYVLDESTTDVDRVFFGNERRASLSNSTEGRSWDWFVPLQLFPDLDFRMGYVYTGASAPTNLTIANISGGSDIYSESTVGIPFWRWSNGSPDAWKQQATIELSGGFVTDKRFIALHPSYFAGLGYQFHKSAWTWQTRFGIGGADVPRLGSGSTVALGPEGLPLYDLKSAPTWGTLITYKLSDAVSLQLGANAFFDSRSTWNIAAGLSVEPGKIFDKLKGDKPADAPKNQGAGN